jgi:hypothetical protein
VETRDQLTTLPADLGLPEGDWQATPASVRALVLTLLQRLEALEVRLHPDFTTSQRSPSTQRPRGKATAIRHALTRMTTPLLSKPAKPLSPLLMSPRGCATTPWSGYG